MQPKFQGQHAILNRLLYSLILICCLAGPAVADLPTPPLQANEKMRLLDGEISLLRDPGGQMDVDEVSAAAAESRFKQLNNGVALGFTKDVIWLRIPLQRAWNAPVDWRLEASSAIVDHYELFARGTDGKFALISSQGDLQPYSTRPFPYRHPVFPIVLADDQAQVYYLRVSSAAAIHFSLKLWQPEGLRNAAQIELLLMGLAFGLIGSIALLNLINWFSVRDAKYLVFSVIGIYQFQALATFLGFTAQFFLPDSPQRVDFLHYINLSLVPATVLLFMRYAVSPVFDNCYLQRATLSCLALSIFAAASIPFGSFTHIAKLIHLLVLSSIFIAAWLALRAHRRKLPGSLSFLAGSLTTLLPIILAVLWTLGIAPQPPWWLEVIWIINVILFAILMHLGLLVDLRTAGEKQRQAESSAAHIKNLMAQEQQLRSEQSIFFSFVAHELRNPLGVITAGLTNLRIGLAGAGRETFERIERISGGAERLRRLIDRHLRLQRLSGADFEPVFAETAPAEPAMQAVAMIREANPERIIDLLLDHSLPYSISIDLELVTLAILNLLDNAIKNSPCAAPVRLKVFSPDSQPPRVVYQVIDHGQGIAEADRARLFNVYARRKGDSSAGFGIGLALVANIARIHDGEIHCASQQEAGASFIFSLPIRDAQGSQP